jgi:NADH:ubiquinone oxidoreductase subunit H
MRFLLFFIGEFATAGAFAAIAATLFLGGWWRAGLDLDSYMNVIGPLVLLAKMMLFGSSSSGSASPTPASVRTSSSASPGSSSSRSRS